MALTEQFIADTSALSRMKAPAVAETLGPLIAGGRVATCAMVEMEVLFSALGANDLDRTLVRRRAAFRWVPIKQPDFDRAIEVMAALARRNQHRSAKIPDLVTASVAERNGLAVIHYDEDFDRIAAVTGQAVRWVVPRGSI
ncbi:MAG TPA: PIN domain nuclease [Candidatus Dormibacteraeota bacterium]|nr:PIN domain nuclease [Candidatus Dormibacteraeota bacterium]